MPVNAAESASTIMTGASRSSGSALGDQPLDQRATSDGGDRGVVGVRSGDGEGQRAPRRDDGGADGARDEGRGDAVGDPGVSGGAKIRAAKESP